eukprot:Rmarinus@m.12242
MKNCHRFFLVNAGNINQIIRRDRVFKDFRPLRLVFCAQYFGSGKTTLGKQFPQKVRTDTNFHGFVLKKLEKKNRWLDFSRLRPEWEHLRNHGIGRLFIDFCCYKNVIRGAADVASEGKSVGTDPSAEDAANLLVSYARRHGPTLFHFDEFGAQDEHSLQELRILARCVWTQMWTIKNAEGADAMPRIYFLVTGKSTAPFCNMGRVDSVP